MDVADGELPPEVFTLTVQNRQRGADGRVRLGPSTARMYPTKLASFFLSFLCALALVAFAVFKTAVYSFDDYIMYYTNWVWTINALFYVADVAGFYDPSGFVHDNLAYWVVWVVFANNVQVFFLVLVVIVNDPWLISVEFEEHDLGTVWLAERVFHVFPLLANIIWMFMRQRDWGAALLSFETTAAGLRHFATFVAGVYVLSVLPMVGYALVYDPCEVYHMCLPWYLETGAILALFALSPALQLYQSPLAARLKGDIAFVAAERLQRAKRDAARAAAMDEFMRGHELFTAAAGGATPGTPASAPAPPARRA